MYKNLKAHSTGHTIAPVQKWKQFFSIPLQRAKTSFNKRIECINTWRVSNCLVSVVNPLPLTKMNVSRTNFEKDLEVTRIFQSAPLQDPHAYTV